MHQHFERGELRVNSVRRGDLELIGGVDLGGELPGLFGGTLQAQRLIPVTTAGSAAFTALPPGGLRRERAFQGVRVELQHDDALGEPVSGSTTTRPERMGLGMSA